MSLSTYYLEDDCHLARLHRRRRHAYAPTSNTASHDNHEKINSWVSFSFLYGYGAPLGGSSGCRSSAILQWLIKFKKIQLEINFSYSLLYLDTITFSLSGSIKRTSSESSEATDIVTLLGLSGGSEEKEDVTVILEFTIITMRCLCEQPWHVVAHSEIFTYF